MARVRMLKPSFFTNEELGQLVPLARLLFQGLWTVADREGRLEDRPLRLKVELLPYDDVDIGPLLDQLQVAGFTVRYEADGGRWIQVVNFAKHQHVHPKEPPSMIPPEGKPSNARTKPGKPSNYRSKTSESTSTSTSTSASLKRKQGRSQDPPARTRASAKDGGDPGDEENPFANLGRTETSDSEAQRGGA